jgi:hypothetical protein
MIIICQVPILIKTLLQKLSSSNPISVQIELENYIAVTSDQFNNKQNSKNILII